MTDADTRLEAIIAREVARQIEPLRAILEKLEAEAGLSSRPAPDAAAPDPAAGPELIRQMTKSGRTRLQMKEAAVRARIAEIEGHVAARLAQPKPQGDTHV